MPLDRLSVSVMPGPSGSGTVYDAPPIMWHKLIPNLYNWPAVPLCATGRKRHRTLMRYLLKLLADVTEINVPSHVPTGLALSKRRDETDGCQACQRDDDDYAVYPPPPTTNHLKTSAWQSTERHGITDNGRKWQWSWLTCRPCVLARTYPCRSSGWMFWRHFVRIQAFFQTY